MKILHIIPSISRKRGGPSTAILNMVKALRTEGIDSSILTTNDNIDYREDDHPLEQWFVYNEVPILMFPSLETKSKLLREYLVAPSLTKWLIENINAYDALHIHSIFSYCSTTSMLIARLKGIPYIVRTIGQLNTWSLSQSRLRKLLMLSIIERKNLERAYAIHVTSRAEMKDLNMIFHPKRILCLELGVEFSSQDLSLEKINCEDLRFVFLSRIHPKKQLDKLLQAFTILNKRRKIKRWHLFIAGDGEKNYIESLKKFADDNNINDRVEWLGHLDEEKKIKLLRSCDWYVLPSKSENFGLSVVEALAAGLPVIVSQEVGISDVIKENNAGLVTNNLFTLVDALEIAFEGASFEMRQSAFKLANEKFSWKEIAKQLSLFYDSLISNTRKQ